MHWPCFHAGQRLGTLPAGGAGSAGALPVEGSGSASRLESVPASPCRGVSFAVSQSQHPDDLVHRVQRRRSGACFAWGRGFRHCCVAVPKSRGWAADVPWLVRWCVGALLVVGVAEGRPRGGCLPSLRGASGVRRCLSPGRPSSGAGSRGSATRASRVRSVRAWGPGTGPTACALAGRRCSPWGGGRASPGGVPSTIVRGV